MKYGIQPTLISNRSIEVSEMMFYLYLPIKMAYDVDLKVPYRLSIFLPLIQDAIKYEKSNLWDHYIYLTVKHLHVNPSYAGNREGYHSDGFMTDDINYIWCDKFPTIFCIQDFDLTMDCSISMKQMEQQALSINEKTYPINSLLRLDQYAIHKVPPITESGMRTFVKISFSKEKYNLKGNSHNYLFDYKWEMHERSKVRNHPVKKESDFIVAK